MQTVCHMMNGVLDLFVGSSKWCGVELVYVTVKICTDVQYHACAACAQRLLQAFFDHKYCQSAGTKAILLIPSIASLLAQQPSYSVRLQVLPAIASLQVQKPSYWLQVLPVCEHKSNPIGCKYCAQKPSYWLQVSPVCRRKSSCSGGISQTPTVSQSTWLRPLWQTTTSRPFLLRLCGPPLSGRWQEPHCQAMLGMLLDPLELLWPLQQVEC